jgi:DNA-binding response OmpR family regulator
MSADNNLILIVDDSMAIRREIRLILENENFVVKEAGNGKIMNYLINEEDNLVDLILMDISLKKENGLNLVKNIKKNNDYANIPIIMLTEHTEKENVLTAKKMKVEGYLKKPIDTSILIKRVKEILG